MKLTITFFSLVLVPGEACCTYNCFFFLLPVNEMPHYSKIQNCEAIGCVLDSGGCSAPCCLWILNCWNDLKSVFIKIGLELSESSKHVFEFIWLIWGDFYTFLKFSRKSFFASFKKIPCKINQNGKIVTNKQYKTSIKTIYDYYYEKTIFWNYNFL